MENKKVLHSAVSGKKESFHSTQSYAEC